MTYLIVLGFYLAILFLVGFFSRRSMGYPALALTAGSIIATLWTDSLTPVVVQAGIIVVQPPMTSLVAVVLTLLPALIVMTRAPKVSSHHHGIVGSLVFAVLAVMLTYAAFSNAVVLDAGSEEIVKQIFEYQAVITTVAIVLAILEVVFYKAPHARDHHKK
jgi:hypothetical protein